MPFDKYTLELSTEEIERIKQSLDTIEKTILHKMINLTSDEKRKLNGPGKKTQYWRNDILMYMEEKPELTPYYVDAEKYKKDVKAIELLKELEGRLKILLEGVEDTSAVIRDDLHTTGRHYFDHVKAASLSTAEGTTTIYRELAPLFNPRKMKSSRKKKE